MGTKNNPGSFDCYANAEPNEPMFVLLGRDPTASLVVTFWRAIKLEMVKQGTSQSSAAKLDEARECSLALEAWAKSKGKDPTEALEAMKSVLAETLKSIGQQMIAQSSKR
jgi:hypothetical protein